MSVHVIGVGMTPFVKPAQEGAADYHEMAREAGLAALADAGVAYDLIEQVVTGYVYGESTSGQRAAYELGLTGAPIYNVNNNCATGSTALMLAKQLVEGGSCDCALALGFEKMERGPLGSHYKDRAHPVERHYARMGELRGWSRSPATAQLFGNAGLEHMERHGTRAEHFAQVAVKNHRHSQANPYAQFQDAYTLDEVLGSPTIHDPLTRLQCCPTSDGAAAAIVASDAFVARHGLQERAVTIRAMTMTTDLPSSFSGGCIELVGVHMTRDAARRAMATAGVSPQDLDVIELHDCFSVNELLTYEALGLCDEGGGGELIESGAVTYGGEWVVNPSGGLISKGHPLGATGLAQCAELVWQLRGEAEGRQVAGAEVALQHNLGMGGAAVVTIYSRG